MDKYRIYADITGELAELFKNKKYKLPFGFKKQLMQKLIDDFVSLSKNKKELKENIVDFISGRITLDFAKTDTNKPKNYLDELKNIKDKF
jgi:hypothetical protein